MKKPKFLIFALIIALGCLGYLVPESLRPGAASHFNEEDFTAFKEKKLRLPAREEPVCLVAVGDIMLSRVGSFGPSKPFWITGEDKSIKNHLFFKLVNGSFKPVWQSSNLDRPNYDAALEDLDGDGKNELVVTEGSYTDPWERQVSIWKWNGWGFSRISNE